MLVCAEVAAARQANTVDSIAIRIKRSARRFIAADYTPSRAAFHSRHFEGR